MDISNTQLDRLGDRLRDSPVPTDEDRAMFENYRSAHDEALRVVSNLGALGTAILEATTVTTRRKTLESTVAKLRRIPTRLSQIHDIAGCRVIVARLSQQDEVLERARQWFDLVVQRDYRTSPQNGYRAVHLVVRHISGTASRFS